MRRIPLLVMFVVNAVVGAAVGLVFWAAELHAATYPCQRLEHLPIPAVPPAPAAEQPAAQWVPSRATREMEQLIVATQDAEWREAERQWLAQAASVDIKDVKASSKDLPAARREIAGMRASFRACLRRSLATSTALGELTMQVTVGPDGRVSDVRTSSRGELPASLVDCAVSRIKEETFEVAGGRGGPIELTLVFRVRRPDSE